MPRKRPIPGRAVAAIALVALARTATPCDVCAVYTATELRERRTGFHAGVAEQLSRFSTLQDDGTEVRNVAHERLVSSITQLWLGYNPTPRFGVQLNVPVVSRQFRRVEDRRLVHGDESGIGDVALVGEALVHSVVTEESVFRFSLLGGLKLPTGDTDRLAEELAEEHHAATRTPRPLHTGGETPAPEEPHGAAIASGVHGHDLALGSGSVDGIVGGRIFWSWRRLFVTAGGQYAIRSEGDFDYTYANDLTWSGGPGAFALLDPRYTLGVQAAVSGETKGNDRQAGVRLDDTAVTALYVGPGLLFTWGTSLAAELVADLPAVQNTSGRQLVPDFRLRGSASWRF